MPDTLAPIAEKLRCCIRLLSSDRDGEVVAVARALLRTLKSNGLNIHAFADCIGRSNSANHSNEIDRAYDRGFAAGKRAAASSREPSWHEITRECPAYPERLRDERERKFVRDMVGRTARGGQAS
jgi:hypothetical protein